MNRKNKENIAKTNKNSKIENTSENTTKNINTSVIKTSNKEEKDGFIKKILSNKFVAKFLNREVILYVFFGIVTTLVNIGSFTLMIKYLPIEETTANNIAIVLAVIVAYFANRNLVFHSEAHGFSERLIEVCRFILGRLFTMFVESFGGSLMFNYLPIPSIASKCLITVIVVILNFFISKFFAFKTSK